MAYKATIIPVMIASPGDVGMERQIVREVIHDWNDVNSIHSGVMLAPVGWDSHSSPELGTRPQELINMRLLADCDLLIGVFWTRIGSPTGQEVSGTVEEIKRHLALGKPAMVYFSQKPVAPDSLDQEQWSKLKEFKKECIKLGLIGAFEDPESFRRMLTKELQVELHKNAYLKKAIGATAADMVIDGGTFDEPVLDVPIMLSMDAADLINAAANFGEGSIYRMAYIGGRHFQAGNKIFGDDVRSAARYEDALQELLTGGLLKDSNGKGQYFELTNAGWHASDAL